MSGRYVASLRPRSKYEHGYDLFEALLGRCRSRCAKRCRLGEFGPMPAALHVAAAQALPARSLVVPSCNEQRWRLRSGVAFAGPCGGKRGTTSTFKTSE